jgi:hypothetical protein
VKLWIDVLKYPSCSHEARVHIRGFFFSFISLVPNLVLAKLGILLGWCTLGCTTFLVPVHSSCTIHRIRKYISKEWSFNLGQNNLLMIGVNHLSQMANKFYLYFSYTCRKKNLRQKTLHVPGLKCTFFGNFLVFHYRFEAGKNILKNILCPSTHTYLKK